MEAGQRLVDDVARVFSGSTRDKVVQYLWHAGRFMLVIRFSIPEGIL